MPLDSHDFLEDLLDEIEHAGSCRSLDDLNRHLARKADEYNARPQAELGGLSPEQMAQLLYGDWERTGALRLREDLTAAELTNAPFVDDARTLLEYVRDAGPVKMTPAGNLPRAAVAALRPRLRLPETGNLVDLPWTPKQINEGDVHGLGIVRHVLLFARLLVRRKGLRVSARGRTLLADEHAGALYALLFRTVFRTLDLRAFDRSDGHAGLQQTVAYSLYRLRSCAEEWSSPEALAEAAWLASARDAPNEFETRYADLRHWPFRSRVLMPLCDFGLLEERRLPAEKPWMAPVEYRKSPLYDRFLRFDFPGSAGRRRR